jgi:hypothetical protein
MNVDAWPRAAIFAALNIPSLDTLAKTSVRAVRINDKRSAGNIEQWRSYLPEDCVSTMIKMGWDQTT